MRRSASSSSAADELCGARLRPVPRADAPVPAQPVRFSRTAEARAVRLFRADLDQHRGVQFRHPTQDARRADDRGGLKIDLTQRREGAKINIRSEEHTSELQSLMRISYAVFCLKKKQII